MLPRTFGNSTKFLVIVPRVWPTKAGGIRLVQPHLIVENKPHASVQNTHSHTIVWFGFVFVVRTTKQTSLEKFLIPSIPGPTVHFTLSHHIRLPRPFPPAPFVVRESSHAHHSSTVIAVRRQLVMVNKKNIKVGTRVAACVGDFQPLQVESEKNPRNPDQNNSSSKSPNYQVKLLYQVFGEALVGGTERRG